MTIQNLRKIEDVGTSEILGENYRKEHPKKSSKSLKNVPLNLQTSRIINIILILSVSIVLLFCLKDKLNLGYPKALDYFDTSLLKDKLNCIKDFIKHSFKGYKKYVTN